MSPTELETLSFERRGAGWWVTLTRPDRRNAIHPQLIADLEIALDAALQDKVVRAVVITGSEDAFCAGADLTFLHSLKGEPAAIVDQLLTPLSHLLGRVRSFPKPVIAAVNGHCVAGGLELVLCCDLVVVAEDAQIADGHARFGLLPAVGGAQGLMRAVGPALAKEMLFTGDGYTGAQMAAAGLASRAVPAADLEMTAVNLVEKLAERDPSGLQRMKQMINDEASMPWALAARYELALTEGHLASGAPAEGLAAFIEGRPPRFGNEPD